ILVLDEPTSMLTPIETKRLFALIKSLKQEGKSVLIITHHLEEAIEVSDRITVMRQGEVVRVLNEDEVEEFKVNPEKGIQTLASLMVGREVLYEFENRSPPPKDDIELMRIEELYVANDMADDVVNGVSLFVKENKILGLAGISGNGQRELIEAILQIRKARKGRVIIRGKEMSDASINEVRESGLSYIPEDRSKAMVFDMSVRENLILNHYAANPGFFLNADSLIEKTDRLIEEYDIKTPSPLTPIRSLSGGNRQKVVVARELSHTYSKGNLILIAENPTIGLDIGTTQFVRQEILNIKNDGAAVLLVSSDLSEIMSLSDEIAVIYKGKIMGVVKIHETSREQIGAMMGGISIEKEERVK
ncbi:MAG: ATP-binding cassette domain-containing protein, partial [Candidatus Kariarchaeaceae archaeon]